MQDGSFQLTVLTIGLLSYALVTAVLRTLAARVSMVLSRHDLLIETKRRRIAFLYEQAARQAAENAESDVAVMNDDEASDVVIEDAPARRAA